MHASLLLVEEGSALALLGIIAVVAVVSLAITIVGLVFAAPYRKAFATGAMAAAPVRHAAPAPLFPAGFGAQVARTRRPGSGLRGVEIDVPTRHVDAIIGALKEAGWSVRETGEVVATDDDEEALTTLAVDVPKRFDRPSTGEEVQ